MKTVVQRVSRAAVHVDGVGVAEIGPGVLLLVGVERGDTDADAEVTARKIATLRMFAGRTPMDRSVAEVAGACLVVSQFTLAASLAKGNRPSFEPAEEPARAEALYLRVAAELERAGLTVQTGRFGADMQVDLVNDGPVTFLVFTRGGSLLKESQ
ncbi:MAG: D-tyrosyl-tRNA(Tyr) deacylase [Deltaproteobacteria bacterium]|nr:D-tyrosyl-tRNA(Tyr) deacylase [Deltaproteobacteria bacterium]